jgi:hypothetical protein
MVDLSPLAGAGWQFFGNNGLPLAGGKLFSYAAGTTTPLATFTSVSGATPHANPIILDSAGRVPSEVWLTAGSAYKFTLKTSADVEIWTKDNISGIDTGLRADLAASSGSSLVGFIQSGGSAVARTAQAKMRDVVSVKDFGAVGNGVVDDTAAIQAAINALPATGGGVYFPAGTYRVSSVITLNKAGTYYGDGYSTKITTASATADIFNVTAEFIHIEKMLLNASVTRSGGWFITVAAGANRFRISDFDFDGAFQGIQTSAAATVTIERGNILNTVATSGVGIRVNAGFDVTIRDILLDGPSQIFAGVYVRVVGDLTIEDCNFIKGGQALYLNPQAGEVISSVWANNTFFDTSGRGLYAQAQGASASIVRCIFDQCWFSGHTNEGVRLETSGGGVIDGMDFIGCHVFLNGSHGISIIDTGVTNVRVNGGAICGNTGNAVEVAANVGDFSFQGAKIGSGYGFGGNLRAFNIAAGSGNNIQITDNDMRGNTNTPVISATGSSVQIFDNLGYDHPFSTYTPTVTTGTGTITTLGAVSGRFQKRGKVYIIQVSIAITTNGTGATDVRFTLPNSTSGAAVYILGGEETAVLGKTLKARIITVSNIALISNYDNTYPGANGVVLVVSGIYEAA